MKHYKSDIPQGVTEVEISDYQQQGYLIYYRVMECRLDNEVVGHRSYDDDGNLMRETPLKNGKRHGREYIWDETGSLESMEPFVDGKMHGLAKQFNRNGKVIGTYRFVHGTGFDIWRYEREDGSIGISEIFTMQAGLLHGYEWWLRDNPHWVWHERHWQHGQFHGIERMWNREGKLKRGYPKYWIRGQAVDKRAYLKAAIQDETLPAYQEKDNRPRRKFPQKIESLINRRGSS